MNEIEPPPSMVELIKGNLGADAIWKKWLNNLYENVRELVANELQAIKFGDSPSIDAFARARVSNPETIFDSKQIHSKQPLLWDERTTGTGAAGT